MQGGTEDIEFLARSETRVQLLEELRRDGELGRDELRSRLDASRTTVQRNLEALEDREWIENGNRTYSLASCGEIIADDFVDLVETVSVVERLQPVLRWVDRSELDFDLRLLADAEVVTRTPGDPLAMVNRHVTRTEEANEARLLLPLTGLHATQAACERVVEHGATMELIVTEDIADTYRSNPNYRRYFDRMSGTERYEVAVYDGEIPYYLGIIDDIVQIGVDEGGEPRALLETENDEVLSWARRTLDDYGGRAVSMDVA